MTTQTFQMRRSSCSLFRRPPFNPFLSAANSILGRLQDVAKLDEFIKAEGDHRFDVETAVRVCRAAGYYEHALWVAKRAGEHEWYLKILLEDLGRYEEALKYVGALATFEVRGKS